MFLRLLAGRDAGRQVPVSGRVVIGRAEDCQLRIFDEAASRHHAEVVAEGAGARLCDLGSTNGTRLNGRPVKQSALADGDVIRIGSAEMAFLERAEQERATVPARPAPVTAAPAAPAPAERPSVSDEERRSRLAVAEPEIIGESPGLLAAVDYARRAAGSARPVLVTGATGTGKELIARLVHRESQRGAGPFVPVNCAAIPPALLESELFGHEAGAFTGAARRRAGYFELADGGTIFLDEIGDLAAALQVKLLRAIESGEFYRVGGSRPLCVDARVVAATNRDLEAAVASGAFRADLFYRLNVLRVSLPPLARRPGDVPLLARYFLRRKGEEMKKPALELAPEALEVLEAYAWPGNVRELANVIERAVVLARSGRIELAELPPDLVRRAPEEEKGSPFSSPMTLAEAERRAVLAALLHTGWKKGEAAKLLGISWPTLNKKIADFGLKPPPELKDS